MVFGYLQNSPLFAKDLSLSFFFFNLARNKTVWNKDSISESLFQLPEVMLLSSTQ